MHIPSSTYRVQLNQDFPFEQLKGIIDYVHDLGISTIYAAPIGKATPGSTHGYDVTDPHRINPEVGKKKDLRELYQMLKEKGMNWVQDIVPNHMAFNSWNVRLMDVLERGENSSYYHYFDINWKHHHEDLHGKVMVPFLGKALAECISSGEITITFSEKGITLNYFDSWYPVSAKTIALLSDSIPESDKSLRQKMHAYRHDLESNLSFETWQEQKNSLIKSISEDKQEVRTLNDVLDRLSHDHAWLNEILRNQHYVLSYWKETEFRINYRRFFTVNSLICLSMEDEEVFNEYHRLIVQFYREGWISGVRIDHIDGLKDPTAYLNQLRSVLGDECYIIAEKILEADETLPVHWPIQGTSGYEFLSAVNKLLTDINGSEKLVKFYRTLIPEVPHYEQLVSDNKKLILERHMAGEVDNLVHYFIELELLNHFDKDRIKDALSGFMLAFPVYRIYPDQWPLSGWGLHIIEETFEKAFGSHPGVKEELSYLRALFVADHPNDQRGENSLRFLKRLMQFTGPLTAKGVEDTTFYIYNPLISHDEVGDAPGVLGTSIQEFHKKMLKRVKENPLALNATATHDTKRGEDARMRLNALSDLPDLWISHVEEWIGLNEVHKSKSDGEKAPSINDEYFIYQSIVGGFPEDLSVSQEWVRRLKEYIVKVVREGKMLSSWEAPNEDYENACTGFIERILSEGSSFQKSLVPMLKQIISIAMENSVIQSVLKITAPGIPDIYQGCELWDLSYVDPDNRRPVDYEKRMMLLSRLKYAFEQGFAAVQKVFDEHKSDGITKLFAIWRTLEMRRANQEVFTSGPYLPLTVLGEGRLVMGYARYYEQQWCIVVVPIGQRAKNELNSLELNRNFISLPANSPRKWRNVFTNKVMEVSGDSIPIEELLADFPLAVLCNA